MTPAEQARIAAGLTVKEAARRARVVPSYLRRVERHGGAPWVLAQRLAFIYNCSANLFLYAAKSQTGGNSTGAVGTPPLSPKPGQAQLAGTSATLPRPATRYRRPAAPILTMVAVEHCKHQNPPGVSPATNKKRKSYDADN
jgi:transcriptional regulator with XRE-family HTH domain